jgi:cystathionine gamma-lyase
MRGFGAVVTVDLDAGEAAARAFCNATRVFSLAEGLGGVESMIGYPFLMSHGAFPAEEKRRKGISEATVRLSVGIENIEDLMGDLEQALAQSTGAA